MEYDIETTPPEQDTPVSADEQKMTEIENSETPENQVPETETSVNVENPDAEKQVPETDEATADAEAKTESETPTEEDSSVESPAVEADNAETNKEEDTDEDMKRAANAVLEDILRENEDFESVIANANPNELILLLDRFSVEAELRPIIPRVGMLKRAFDSNLRNLPKEEHPGLLSRFNSALARFNKRRDEYEAEQELEKAKNSAIKRELLDQLHAIVETEKVTAINEVRNIQEKWRETGWIRQEDMMPFNAEYRQYLDVFYTLRGHYRDLLDLDRRHNLDEKRKILTQIEELTPADETLSRESWRERSEKIKNLQEVWKSIGPVPKEEDDANFQKYKDLLDSFYSLRQEYYESQDEGRNHNATKKTIILQALRTYAEYSSEKAKDWNAKTKEILAIQQEWNKIGPAPTELNKEMWADFRKICDTFFANKTKFFKAFDEMRTKNMELKMAIIEKAESLKDSTDWKKTANDLKKLQEEWKNVGPVSDRYSNKIWKRFRSACDHFFTKRNESRNEGRAEEKSNLAGKEALVAKLKELSTSEEPKNKLIQAFKEVQAEWSKFGFVPFKDKDRINNEYRSAVDALFAKVDLKASEGAKLRMEAKLDNIGDEDQRKRRIKDEIKRFDRQIAQLNETISNYETNIQMISNNKSSQGFRDMVEKKILEERKKLDRINDKIKSLRDLMKKPKPAEKEPEAPAESPTAEKENNAAPLEETKAEVVAEEKAETPAEPATEAKEEKTEKVDSEEKAE